MLFVYLFFDNKKDRERKVNCIQAHDNKFSNKNDFYQVMRLRKAVV